MKRASVEVKVRRLKSLEVETKKNTALIITEIMKLRENKGIDTIEYQELKEALKKNAKRIIAIEEEIKGEEKGY